MEIQIKSELPLGIKIICLLITLTALTQFIFVMGMIKQGNISGPYKLFWHSLWILNLVLIYGLWGLQKSAYYFFYLIGLIHIIFFIYVGINFPQSNQIIEISFEIVLWISMMIKIFNKNIRNLYGIKSKDYANNFTNI